MDIEAYMDTVGRNARAASRRIAAASTEAKNAALRAIAGHLRARQPALLDANAADLAQARADALEAALIDRLTLTAAGVESMAQGLEQIAALPDPVGEISDMKRRPSGIQEIGRAHV